MENERASARARGARGPGEAPRLSLSAGYLFSFLVVIASSQPSSPLALEGHAWQTGRTANLRALGFLSLGYPAGPRAPWALWRARPPRRWLRALLGRAGWEGPCGQGSWFVGGRDGLLRADSMYF